MSNQLFFPQVLQWQIGEGRCRLYLILLNTGAGIQGLLTGGEKPHIGGVVLAVPRLSLSGEGWSTDLYITPVPQHKDVELAKPLAEALARLLHYPVVISAGIHSEDLSRAELETIIKNSEELKNKALRDLETYFVREASEKDF